VSVWRWIFWSLFVLNWPVIPYLQQLECSGYLQYQDKFKEALLWMAIWYLGMAAVGVAFFVYLYMRSNLGL